LEETYVGNLVQSAVTGQADLISTNNRLIAHLVESADREMRELRKEIQMLRGISIRGEGQLSLMNMEISRLVDTMHNLEKSLAIIKELMTAWVQTLPVMSDPEEEGR
jgi:chromosome segregation ATPase